MSAYRLNVPALHRLVDEKRCAEGLSWRQLGNLTGITASTFSRMPKGLAPDAHALVSLLMWLNRPVNQVARLVCGTCRSKPKPGYKCLECGTEAQR